MKTTKKIAIVFIVLIAIGLLVFASIKLQIPRRIKLWHPTEETIRKDVTEYLEERYNEEFVITNILFPSFNYASYIITAYPVGAPQKTEYKITIHGWENKGLINYYDSYPVVKLIPELGEYMSDVFGEYFPENKVYVDFYNEWIRENIEKDLSLNKFLSNKESEWYGAAWCHICIPRGELDDELLLSKLNETAVYMGTKGLSGTFFIIIMYNNYDNFPDSFDDMEIGKYDKDFVNYVYNIDKNGNASVEREVRTHGTE